MQSQLWSVSHQILHLAGTGAGTSSLQKSCKLAERTEFRPLHTLACKRVEARTDSSEPSDQVTRRQSLFLSSILLLGGGITTPAVQAKVNAPLAAPACNEKLEGPLAAAFLQSLYEAILEMKVMEPQQFQLENFKLRDREWPYYQAAMKDRLSVLPGESSDM